MLAQHLADRRRVAGDHIEHALGIPACSASSASASAVSGVSLAGLSTTVQPAASAGETFRVIIVHGKFHGVIRRRRRSAAGSPAGAHRALGRNGLAIHAAGFFRKKFDIGRADIDFAARFGQRLALLGGEDQREVLAVGDDQVEPSAQDVGALFRGELRPVRECAFGRLDRAVASSVISRGTFASSMPFTGLVTGSRRSGPGAVDEAAVAQQRRSFSRSWNRG